MRFHSISFTTKNNKNKSIWNCSEHIFTYIYFHFSQLNYFHNRYNAWHPHELYYQNGIDKPTFPCSQTVWTVEQSSKRFSKLARYSTGMKTLNSENWMTTRSIKILFLIPQLCQMFVILSLHSSWRFDGTWDVLSNQMAGKLITCL